MGALSAAKVIRGTRTVALFGVQSAIRVHPRIQNTKRNPTPKFQLLVPSTSKSAISMSPTPSFPITRNKLTFLCSLPTPYSDQNIFKSIPPPRRNPTNAAESNETLPPGSEMSLKLYESMLRPPTSRKFAFLEAGI